MMYTLVNIELKKIFKKWRTYIGFIAIGLLTPIVQLSLHYEGSRLIKFFTQNLSQAFVFSGNLINGYLIAHLILQSLVIHIPFLIVLVGGDLLAGEATAGTYRMLLTRPVSRFQVVTAKILAGFIYTNLLILWLAIISCIGSILIFGPGELLVITDKIYIFARSDVIWRFLLAYGYATLSMMTVLSLSFLFSSLVENAIGPIVGTMTVIIVLLIISTLPIEALNDVKYYFFTTHMSAWKDFFTSPLQMGKIVYSGLFLLLHIFIFYSASLLIFIRKDILS